MTEEMERRSDLPECLFSEQDVQGLSVIGMSLSVQKDPIFLQQDLGGRVDQTWFSMVWRVHDLPRHLVGGSENDKARNRQSDGSQHISGVG